MNKKKLLSVCAGMWVGAISTLVVKTYIDTRFNLDTTLKLLHFIEQEQYDGRFNEIVNDLQEPPAGKN